MLDFRSWNYECVCGGKHMARPQEENKKADHKPTCAYCAAELPARFAGCNLYYSPVEAPPKGEF